MSDDEEIYVANTVVLSGKLLQMANGCIYDEDKKALKIHDRKLDVLDVIIESANGKQLLGAYWFLYNHVRIKERFRGREIKIFKDIEDWNRGKIADAG